MKTLNKTQHTQGEWLIQESPKGMSKSIYTNNINPIATIWGIVNREDNLTELEAEANSKLIAAAPLMLEMLKLAVERLEINNIEKSEQEFIDQINEAIKKATRKI